MSSEVRQDEGTNPGGILSAIDAARDGFVQDQGMQASSGADQADLELVTEVAARMRKAMATVIVGKPDVINTATVSYTHLTLPTILRV